MKCPICEQPLSAPPPAVEQLRMSLDSLETQITAVRRDRPGLVTIDDELETRAASVREQLTANRAALDALAASAEV